MEIIYLVQESEDVPSHDILLGFLISDLGECKLINYLNIPSIKMICARQDILSIDLKTKIDMILNE